MISPECYIELIDKDNQVFVFKVQQVSFASYGKSKPGCFEMIVGFKPKGKKSIFYENQERLNQDLDVFHSLLKK